MKMSSEDSVISVDKSDFHGFNQTTNFDYSYAYMVNNISNHANTSGQIQDKYGMFSSNFLFSENSQERLNLKEVESCTDSSSLQANSKVFKVLQRPPVVIDIPCSVSEFQESSSARKKLVYAPISPVAQSSTPVKVTIPEQNINMLEEQVVVLKHDAVYNKYSKNRGQWDINQALEKTSQLLGHYYKNMLCYNDVDSPEKPVDEQEDMEIAPDISLKTSQTPKSTSKTDGSNNESTPLKSNDDSTCESKSVTAVKISPPFLSMENSNNATDNSIKIKERLNLKSDLCHDFMGPLSFENKITNMKKEFKPKYSEAIKSDEDSMSDSTLMKLGNEASQCAPLSPCLFSSDESNDENLSSPISLGYVNKTPQEEERDRLKHNDLALLKRLQKTLSGVLPPPSVTITQLDLSQILDLYKTNLASYNDMSVQQTSLDRALTDSVLDNSSSTTPPSLQAWASLPEGFDSMKFSESESMPPVVKSNSSSSVLQNNSLNHISNSLLISCTLDDVLKASWPKVMHCRYHGVHYNRSSVSEEFESLCMKFSERYIGAETQTSCTLGTKPYSRKSTVSRYAQSPGRRLSHLARRRQTFSSANLQAGCSLETKAKKPVTSARQIMLSTKRSDCVNRRRYRAPATRRTPGRKTPGKKTPSRKTPSRKTPGRKTPGRKTPGKKTPGKATPSTSTKKRRLICRRTAPEDPDSTSSCSSSSMKPTRESSKRALFQSPPHRANENLLTRNDIPTSIFRSDKLQCSKRALFPSPKKQDEVAATSGTNPNQNHEAKKRVSLSSTSALANTSKNGASLFSPFIQDTTLDVGRKRKFSEIRDSVTQSSPKSKLPRSLSFNTNSTGGAKVLTRRSSENVVGSNSRHSSAHELSDNHRKKLLWAVAEALRSQNIGMSHPQFKAHAAVLARLTRKLVMEDTERVGSTSEKMLRFAKLHVFSVIKGKTVEEIMIEEHVRKAKASNAKLTGYVPLSEYEQNKISALNKRLIKPVANDQNASNNLIKDRTSTSQSNAFVHSDQESSNSLSKTVLQDKSLNLENNLVNPIIKARRQICFDDCSKR